MTSLQEIETLKLKDIREAGRLDGTALPFFLDPS